MFGKLNFWVTDTSLWDGRYSSSNHLTQGKIIVYGLFIVCFSALGWLSKGYYIFLETANWYILCNKNWQHQSIWHFYMQMKKLKGIEESTTELLVFSIHLINYHYQVEILESIIWMIIYILAKSNCSDIPHLITKSAVSKGDWCGYWLCFTVSGCDYLAKARLQI